MDKLAWANHIDGGALKYFLRMMKSLPYVARLASSKPKLFVPLQRKQPAAHIHEETRGVECYAEHDRYYTTKYKLTVSEKESKQIWQKEKETADMVLFSKH